MRNIFLVFIIMAFLAPAAGAEFGVLSGSIGSIAPQGDYAAFADPGLNICLQATYHPLESHVFALWVSGSLAVFSAEDATVQLDIDGASEWADRQINDKAYIIHLGIRLGSRSYKPVLRPFVSAGPGIYVFDTETKYKLVGQPDWSHIRHNTETGFGWRGVLGTDIYFSEKFGVRLECFFDDVYGLNPLDTEETDNIEARYISYMIGIVIPFEFIN